MAGGLALVFGRHGRTLNAILFSAEAGLLVTLLLRGPMGWACAALPCLFMRAYAFKKHATCSCGGQNEGHICCCKRGRRHDILPIDRADMLQQASIYTGFH